MRMYLCDVIVSWLHGTSFEYWWRIWELKAVFRTQMDIHWWLAICDNQFSLGPSYQVGRVYKWKWSGYVCASSLRRWSLFLLVGSTDPYNHTYYESFWWKLFKNHKSRRQWQRQRQRQIHRQSAWKTQHMLYFWNPDDLLIPNLMIDTSPWSSCSRRSPWLPCSGHTISSTGPSVSPFRDFFI